VVGDPDSIVRLGFGRRGLSAYVRTDDDTLVVKPLEENDEQFDDGLPAHSGTAHRTASAAALAAEIDVTCGSEGVSERSAD